MRSISPEAEVLLRLHGAEFREDADGDVAVWLNHYYIGLAFQDRDKFNIWFRVANGPVPEELSGLAVPRLEVTHVQSILAVQ